MLAGTFNNVLSSLWWDCLSAGCWLVERFRPASPLDETWDTFTILLDADWLDSVDEDRLSKSYLSPPDLAFGEEERDLSDSEEPNIFFHSAF